MKGSERTALQRRSKKALLSTTTKELLGICLVSTGFFICTYTFYLKNIVF
jgi:hypothetical protein